MRADAIGVGEDGENGIEAAVGDVDAGVDHVEVVDIVDAAPGIDDGGFGIVSHAAGAGLMLAAAQRRCRRSCARFEQRPLP